MKTSPKGVMALVIHEGIVPGPYFDSVGVLTFGVGHTAAAGSPNPEGMPAGMPDDMDMTLQFIFKLLALDLEKYEAAVNAAITVPMTQYQFDAALSFHYNTGAIGKATWVKTFNAGDSVKAAAQIMNYSKPKDIIPRRKSEQALFRSGVYPSGNATVWNVGTNRKVIWKAARSLTPADVLALMSPAPTPQKPPRRGLMALIAPAIVTVVLAVIAKISGLF